MKDRVYAVGYRPLPDERRIRIKAWAIARNALLLAWRQKSTKLALMFCGSVFLVSAAALVGQNLIGRLTEGKTLDAVLIGQVIGNANEVFSAFLQFQFFATGLLMAVVGAPLIADDRQAGALDLYFARPLTRMDYVGGKLLAAGLACLGTLLVPVLLMWLAVVGLAPEEVRGPLMWLVVPASGGAIIASLVLTTTIVGASSLGERGRTVGVAYFVILGVLSGLGRAGAAAGYAWAGYLAPDRDLRTVVDTWLQVGYQSMAGQALAFREIGANDSATLSLLALLALAAGGLAVFWLQLRKAVVG